MQTDKSGLEVRTAVPDDCARIASVLYDSFVEYESLYTAEAFAATTPTPDQIRARLNEGPVWVAVQNMSIVGTVSAVSRSEELSERPFLRWSKPWKHQVNRNQI